MVIYSVEFTDEAEKDLARIDKNTAQRILNKLRWLAENFDMIKPERLKGELWKDKFKLRVGDYRIIYSVDFEKKIITVHLIGHRSEIYK
jgi:mRNA interferase RelE/StbE